MGLCLGFEMEVIQDLLRHLRSTKIPLSAKMSVDMNVCEYDLIAVDDLGVGN